jgi:hypothetical protein
LLQTYVPVGSSPIYQQGSLIDEDVQRL